MAQVPRNHQERPYIYDLDGKLTTYSRCSKYAEALSDSYALQVWAEHMTAIGLAENPWLLMKVAAHADAYRAKEEGYWDQMSEYTSIAKVKAGSQEKAEWGSEFHKLTEQIDLGFDTQKIEGPMSADLAAYQYETEELKVREVERFVVIDEVRAAGSFDRIYADGRIGDIKTGKPDKQQHMIQLALYAHGQYYECLHEVEIVDGKELPTKEQCLEAGPEGHKRTPVEGVDQGRALLVHVPYQEGTCNLYDIDIKLGWWAATEVIPKVRQWRREKVLHPFNSLPPF